jgi:hypothetical protein
LLQNLAGETCDHIEAFIKSGNIAATPELPCQSEVKQQGDNDDCRQIEA